MNPQRSELLRVTLGLAGAGLFGIGLGVGVSAAIFGGSAIDIAMPRSSAIAAPATTPPAAFVLASSSDPVRVVLAPPARSIQVAALNPTEIVPASDPILPPVTLFEASAPAVAPDPVQDADEAVPSADVAATDTAEPEPDEAPAPRPLVSLFRPAPVDEDVKPVARLVETPNECLVAEICIDDYLWSFYERTPKVDTNKVKTRVKALVKKKGKTRVVMKTVTRYVVADFTWKDPIAAERAGLSLKDYVIGGMDRGFKLKLYYALRAMEDAGMMPGITSAFRDDYRQGIAAGNKAASDSSYHGGSRRGGYGFGLAADLVSVKGETRLQRLASSVELWKWIDAREKELGIGRPYLNRDPPHVGPIDGTEFAVKRGRAKAKLLATNRRHPVAVRADQGAPKPAPKAMLVRVGSI